MATKQFQQNHDYKIEKSFPCRGEHVCRDLDARGGKNYEQAHTHTHTRGVGQPQ